MNGRLDLGDLMERSLHDLQPRVAPVDDLVAGGRRLARRHRRRRLTAGLLAVCVASLGVAVGVGHLSGRPPGPADLPQEMPQGQTAEQLYAWAQQLPEGPAARVAYVVGGRTVVAGDHRLELPAGTQVELEGTLSDGWLVQYGDTGAYGNWTHIRTGELSTDGAFRRFAFDLKAPQRGSGVRGMLVSPDGSQVAYDGHVVEVATGQPVATLPRRPLVMDQWTSRGIEYDDRRGGCCTPVLWDPVSGVVRNYHAYDSFIGPDLLLAYGRHCSRLSRLGPDARPTPWKRLCGTGVSDVATDGTVVTRRGDVLDASGREIASLPLPPPPPAEMGVFSEGAGCCGLHWESPGHLLVTLTNTETGDHTGTLLILRCTIGEGSVVPRCERASGEVRDVTWGFFQSLPSAD